MESLDPESGFYYLRARMYDPLTGRFISHDPIDGYLENPQTQNPYAYAGNNPINLSDPSGEQIPPQVIQTGINLTAACGRFVASSAINAVNLAKSLASQQQMAEEGKIFAGGNSGTAFRDAQQIAQQYGGQAMDWVKKASSSFTALDGVKLETHWVENLETGIRVLEKTKLSF